MSDRRNNRRVQDFLQYLRGETSGRERNLFERELEGDPFAKEAMEGFEQLSDAQLEEDLLSLHDRLRKRITVITSYSIHYTKLYEGLFVLRGI